MGLMCRAVLLHEAPVTKPGSVVCCVTSIHLPLFTFLFCTCRTLQKPPRPPHLGEAMESEYFLLCTSVWEQVAPRGGGKWFSASQGKDQTVTQWFGSCRYVSNMSQVENTVLGYRIDLTVALGLWG